MLVVLKRSVLEDVLHSGHLTLLDDDTLVGMTSGDFGRLAGEGSLDILFTRQVGCQTGGGEEGVDIGILQLHWAEALWAFQDSIKRPHNTVATGKVIFHYLGLQSMVKQP